MVKRNICKESTREIKVMDQTDTGYFRHAQFPPLCFIYTCTLQLLMLYCFELLEEKSKDRTKLTPGANLKFQLWIPLLGSEMGGSVLLQQLPGVLVAIFIMQWGLSLTEAAPNFFLRQECRHQLMYGPKLILFPPERPLGQAGELFLGNSCGDT